MTYERQDVHEHGLVWAVLSGGDCFGVTTVDASCVDPGYAVDVRVVSGWIRSTMWKHGGWNVTSYRARV